MTPDIAGIANGLSEAQREFITGLPDDESWHPSHKLIHGIQFRHGPNSLRGFGKSGFVEGYYREVTKHRLTHLGVRVRHHLTKGP